MRGRKAMIGWHVRREVREEREIGEERVIRESDWRLEEVKLTKKGMRLVDK